MTSEAGTTYPPDQPLPRGKTGGGNADWTPTYTGHSSTHGKGGNILAAAGVSYFVSTAAQSRQAPETFGGVSTD